MQSILHIGKIFGFFVALSRSRVFVASYFVWTVFSIAFCLPLDFLYDSCGFLSIFSNFNDPLRILIEGFFSFAFNEWREDLVVAALF